MQPRIQQSGKLLNLNHALYSPPPLKKSRASELKYYTSLQLKINKTSYNRRRLSANFNQKYYLLVVHFFDRPLIFS